MPNADQRGRNRNRGKLRISNSPSTVHRVGYMDVVEHEKSHRNAGKPRAYGLWDKGHATGDRSKYTRNTSDDDGYGVARPLRQMAF